MKKIAIALILVSCSAAAGDFAARVAAGNRAIATPEGKIYDAALGPSIQAAMLACVPPGSPPQNRIGKFVLVGSVDASGRLSSVVAEPSTQVSRCFADRFGSGQLPPPPSSGHSGQAYPVTVEMTVTP